MKPPVGPFVDVQALPAVLARCETVQWQDAVLSWNTDKGYSLWIYRSGTWTGAPASALGQKTIALDDGLNQLVNNGTPFTTLDSTFTCTRTGEVLKSGYTFPNAGSSAVIMLDIQNGKLSGQYRQYLPLD